MKQRLLPLAAVFCLILCALALAACGFGSSDPPHNVVVQKKHHPKKDKVLEKYKRGYWACHTPRGCRNLGYDQAYHGWSEAWNAAFPKPYRTGQILGAHKLGNEWAAQDCQSAGATVHYNKYRGSQYVSRVFKRFYKKGYKRGLIANGCRLPKSMR